MFFKIWEIVLVAALLTVCQQQGQADSIIVPPAGGSISSAYNANNKNSLNLGVLDLSSEKFRAGSLSHSDGGFGNGGTTHGEEIRGVRKEIGVGDAKIGTSLGLTKRIDNGNVVSGITHNTDILGTGFSASLDNDFSKGIGIGKSKNGGLQINLLGLKATLFDKPQKRTDTQAEAQGLDTFAISNSNSEKRSKNFGIIGLQKTQSESNALSGARYGTTSASSGNIYSSGQSKIPTQIYNSGDINSPQYVPYTETQYGPGNPNGYNNLELTQDDGVNPERTRTYYGPESQPLTQYKIYNDVNPGYTREYREIPYSSGHQPDTQSYISGNVNSEYDRHPDAPGANTNFNPGYTRDHRELLYTTGHQPDTQSYIAGNVNSEYERHPEGPGGKISHSYEISQDGSPGHSQNLKGELGLAGKVVSGIGDGLHAAIGGAGAAVGGVLGLGGKVVSGIGDGLHAAIGGAGAAVGGVLDLGGKVISGVGDGLQAGEKSDGIGANLQAGIGGSGGSSQTGYGGGGASIQTGYGTGNGYAVSNSNHFGSYEGGNSVVYNSASSGGASLGYGNAQAGSFSSAIGSGAQASANGLPTIRG